ncbi:hypothetical protein B4N89_27800 [Embleya scabrispora]|uniref:Uncharacterized protein n=1 Tax=Embleya scabrispora TaxID=159449 RepID=A0A1T3P557_9ACTN|nr:hypothetical protein [Embleya scabrispora]OPC84227.1 hypothetical protein B4N89_27800 [Embleya scabrispora]
MPQPRPTVGRIVHYVGHGSPVRDDGTQAYPAECRAAIVTEVPHDGFGTESVGLCILNPGGVFFGELIIHDENDHAGGTWHWPEREAA